MRCRKWIAEIFGWGKITGGLARLKRRGLDTVNAVFVSGMAACNIVRPPKLIQATGDVCRDGRKQPERNEKSAGICR